MKVKILAKVLKNWLSKEWFETVLVRPYSSLLSTNIISPESGLSITLATKIVEQTSSKLEKSSRSSCSPRRTWARLSRYEKRLI